MKEATLWDVPTQPFQPHPVIPHKLDRFGCTMCHRGQGAATTVSEAHNSTLASAGAADAAGEVHLNPRAEECHRGPLPGTLPVLNQGRQPALPLRLRELPQW